MMRHGIFPLPDEAESGTDLYSDEQSSENDALRARLAELEKALDTIAEWSQELEDSAEEGGWTLSHWRGCVAIAREALGRNAKGAAEGSVMSEFMVRHARNDFEALMFGMSAYEVGCRVVSICPYEMRGGTTNKPMGRVLLVWIECPNKKAIDAVDAAIAAKRKS